MYKRRIFENCSKSKIIADIQEVRERFVAAHFLRKAQFSSPIEGDIFFSFFHTRFSGENWGDFAKKRRKKQQKSHFLGFFLHNSIFFHTFALFFHLQNPESGVSGGDENRDKLSR